MAQHCWRGRKSVQLVWRPAWCCVHGHVADCIRPGRAQRICEAVMMLTARFNSAVNAFIQACVGYTATDRRIQVEQSIASMCTLTIELYTWAYHIHEPTIRSQCNTQHNMRLSVLHNSHQLLSQLQHPFITSFGANEAQPNRTPVHLCNG